MRARCEQCGSLWQLDAPSVQAGQPYQCNACGHIFTIALEEQSIMQIRHTNGKIYKVKDLPTLLRWVGEKRVPRQSMIRGEGGEWQDALNIPEVAEAFAELDARRKQRREALVAASAETTAAAPPNPPQTPPDIQQLNEDVASKLSEADIAAVNEAEAAIRALDDALHAEPAEPAGPAAAEPVEPAAPAEPADIEGIFAEAAANGDSAADGDEFDDAFDLLNQMTQEPSEVPGLTMDPDFDDDDDEDEAPKKSKMPLIAAVVVVLGLGGYFAVGSGGGAATPKDDSPELKALMGIFKEGLDALGSGDATARAKAIKALDGTLCLDGCDAKQCRKDEAGGCALDPAAAHLAAFAFLADRLWIEGNQTDAQLQKLAGGAQKALTANEKDPLGAARLAAFADFWNGVQPAGKEADNRAAALLGELAKAMPRSADTAVLVALKQLDGGQAAAAAPLLTEAASSEGRPADQRLVALAKARTSRAQAKPGACGAVSEAYLSAVKAGLPSASRELALFLAANGDLAGAAKAAGERAGSDPLLGGIAKASARGPELTDAQLKARFAAQNKKTMRNRKAKKIIGFLYKKLAKNPDPTTDRGNTLKGIQEMFPNAIKELEESAWIEVVLGQAAEGEAKAAHGAEALKRFDGVLGVDPNRRDALLGRAAAGALTGKAADHAVDAYAWLFSAATGDKGLCSAQ